MDAVFEVPEAFNGLRQWTKRGCCESLGRKERDSLYAPGTKQYAYIVKWLCRVAVGWEAGRLASWTA